MNYNHTTIMEENENKTQENDTTWKQLAEAAKAANAAMVQALLEAYELQAKATAGMSVVAQSLVKLRVLSAPEHLHNTGLFQQEGYVEDWAENDGFAETVVKEVFEAVEYLTNVPAAERYSTLEREVDKWMGAALKHESKETDVPD